MRVCLVSSALHAVPLKVYGAVEAQMMGHARGLVRRNHEVHVVTVGDRAGYVTDEQDGIVFHRLGLAYEDYPEQRTGGLVAAQTRFSRAARALFASIDPDLVHCHARYPCLVIAGKGRGCRAERWRLVYHAHNWKRAERMRYPILSPRRMAAVLGVHVDRRLARRCDHIIAISDFVRREIHGSVRIDPARITVLTNIVDTEVFRPDPTVSGREGVVFVGRLAEEKGVTTAIEAMALVVRAHPDARLTIVGPDADGTERGAYARRCVDLVRRRGLESSVHFAGKVPNHELPSVLRRSRALLVPSIWGEPCGVVVLEGMACGVPVVASRVGGIPELIDDGRTGLLVPPADPEAWAASISRALQDGALAKHAATDGPEAIARRHSWSSVERKLESIYENVLGGDR